MKTHAMIAGMLLLAAGPAFLVAAAQEYGDGGSGSSTAYPCEEPRKICKVYTECSEDTGECKDHEVCYEEPGECRETCDRPTERCEVYKVCNDAGECWEEKKCYTENEPQPCDPCKVKPEECERCYIPEGCPPPCREYDDRQHAADGTASSHPAERCPPPPPPCYDDRQYNADGTTSHPAEPCPPPCREYDDRQYAGDTGETTRPADHRCPPPGGLWLEAQPQDARIGEPVKILVRWYNMWEGQLAVWIVSHERGEEPRPATEEPHRDCVDGNGNFVRCEDEPHRDCVDENGDFAPCREPARAPPSPPPGDVVYKFEIGPEGSKPEGAVELVWKQTDQSGNQVPEGGYEIRAQFGTAWGGSGVWIGGERPDRPPPCAAYGRAEARAYAEARSDGGYAHAESSAYAEARANPIPTGWHCGFTYENGWAKGRHVSFHVDEANGVIQRFVADGNPVFVEVKTTDTNPLTVKNLGWLFLKGGVASYGALDVPGGALAAAACGPAGSVAHFKLALAEGVEAKQDGNTVFLGRLGIIVVEGDAKLSLEGSVVYAEVAAHGIRCDPENEEMPRSFLMFRGHGSEDFDNYEERPDVARGKAEAIAARQLGAEAQIRMEGDVPRLETVDYTGVRVELKEAVRGRSTLTVDSDRHEGKIVTFRLPKAVLDVMKPEDVAVLFDATGARLASSFDELRAGLSEPVYVVVITSAHVEVLLWVPGFSVHTVQIQSVAGGLSSPMWIGALAGFAAIATAAALALRPRKQ